MRYAFVFVSIVMMWVAALVLAAVTAINAYILFGVVVAMTLVLFIIGFRKGNS